MLAIGKTAEYSKTIYETDISDFARLTGDFNDMHMNASTAKESIFGDRIAHGMLVGSFISTVLGMHLPGPGTIYLEQNLKFIRPVYIGDTVTAKVTVQEILNAKKGIYLLSTIVTNQKGENVIEGNAKVKYLQ